MDVPLHEQILDAVVASLSGAPAGTFSLSFTPVIDYAPLYSTADLERIRVTVAPRDQAEEWHREGAQESYGVDIAVQQRLAEPTRDHIRRLQLLVQEIRRYWRETGTTTPYALCTDVRVDPVLYQRHLAELGVFTSVVRLTFLAVVDD